MVYPTIHLNGTSKDRLLEDIEKAYAAINDAQQALRNAAPNGRDYYPQGPDVICTALNEHLARQQKLQDVLLELQDLAEHIDAGGNR
jgi:hypothetical protein